MAEGGWISKVRCRYFMHGICHAGSNCHYAHDRTSAPSSICKYYAKGDCSYGSRCRYDHVRPSSTRVKPSPKKQADPDRPGEEEVNGTVYYNIESQKKRDVLLQPSNEKRTSKFVTLRKGQSDDSGVEVDSPVASPLHKDPQKWVKAAEFIPGQLYTSAEVPSSYCDATKSGLPEKDDVYQKSTLADTDDEYPSEATVETRKLLCPFAAHGECRYGENCVYTHGDTCDLCSHAVLFPGDVKQNLEHKEECMKELEKDMEISFAVQRTNTKSCGICMETVAEKDQLSERRFGILSNCNHCFCLECIRKWRQAKQFENKVIRACPECRVTSDFVTPSQFWVEEPNEKKALIEGYKNALSQKSCKYFKKGEGECPFNEKCFYKHAYPDGRIASPKQRRRRRQRQESDNDESISELMQELFLWEFIEERENRLLIDFALADVLGNIFLSSDSDSDSDYDPYDIFW